jgi:hypothetical protein
MSRVFFLERLRASVRLIELAMRLSVAKGLVKAAKADPLVAPYLDELGRIRRDGPRVGFAADSSHFKKVAEGAGKNDIYNPSKQKLLTPIGNHKITRHDLRPGILISRNQSNPLEALAHEVGHAKDAGAISGRDRRRLEQLHEAAVNREKKRRREQLMGKVLVKEGGQKQMRRAMNSRQYTTERIATHNGANILRQAGATDAELADYYQSVVEVIPGGKRIKMKKMSKPYSSLNASYSINYKNNKAKDPKQRFGGEQLRPPRVN